MDYKYIEQLVDRYFDCETTVSEERILKTFFSQNDVPAHLQQYADIFAYEADSVDCQLDEDFDNRVIERLETDGDAPVVHVKIQRLTFADRFRPLFRSAAAVAIVVLVGGSMHRAYVNHSFEPISQYGTEVQEAEQVSTPDAEEYNNASRFMQEGKKVAITFDSLNVKSAAD